MHLHLWLLTTEHINVSLLLFVSHLKRLTNTKDVAKMDRKSWLAFHYFIMLLGCNFYSILVNYKLHCALLYCFISKYNNYMYTQCRTLGNAEGGRGSNQMGEISYIDTIL